MIEFKLKFRITKTPAALSKFKETGKSVQKDFYYDTADYTLIQSGNFLRVRNDKKIDFKLNIGDKHHLYCQETSFLSEDIAPNNNDFLSIFKALNIKPNLEFTDFDSFVKNNSLTVLAPIIKHRTCYKIDDTMSVTIDKVPDLGTFMEVEMMFDDSYVIKDKHELRDQIIKRLKELNLYGDKLEAINIGYVELYLLKNNRAAYELGIYKS